MPVVINGSTGISGTDGSAATPAIQGTDTNTGMYFPGNDRIAFAEGGVQVGEFDASSNFLFNSGYGSVAIAYGCRAWVNFNGTGTVAIRGSGNISSITDNNTGDYTVNFTNVMPDVNFCVTGITRLAATNTFVQLSPDATEIGAGFVRVKSGTIAGANIDTTQIHIAIFR